MDIPTDSDSGDELTTLEHDIHAKSLPVCVTWRDANGQDQSLTDLDLALAYEAGAHKASIKLQTSTRLKKGPAKPSFFLFIRPEQIRQLTCTTTEEDTESSEAHQERYARDKLSASTFALRFELQSPVAFVVPNVYPFQFFRSGSQAVWTSWAAFSRDTMRFTVHLPATALPKARLVAFCQTASSGTLASSNNEISSLYGGKGGRVVNSRIDDEESVAPEASVQRPDEDAPPSYKRDAPGSSVSAVAPPLCLSPSESGIYASLRVAAFSSSLPGRDPSLARKRRRRDSSIDLDEPCRFVSAPHEKGDADASRLWQAIFTLQRTREEDRAMYEATLAKARAESEHLRTQMAQLQEQYQRKVESLETEIGDLRQSQAYLQTELEEHSEPLWDELCARLQSQDDRERAYIRDVVDDVLEEGTLEKMDQKIDDKLEKKIPDALGQFFRDDTGQHLVGWKIRDGVRDGIRDLLGKALAVDAKVDYDDDDA